ncbi:AAA family ATPase [Lactiplantibacillus plantarum]
MLRIHRRLNQKYDYVIIDLPPARNLLTKNGVAVADKIISPMEPSRFGYESHTKVLQSVGTLLFEVVDPVSGKNHILLLMYSF